MARFTAVSTNKHRMLFYLSLTILIGLFLFFSNSLHMNDM